MTDTEVLKAELERLFELEDLLNLSKNVLGFDPITIGGTLARASFADALVAHCIAEDAVPALCEALIAVRPGVSARVLEILANGFSLPDDIPEGGSWGPFEQLTRLGEGRLGVSYLGTRSGSSFRVKLLRREARRDRAGLARLLTVTRLSSSIEHPHLPQRLEVGTIDDRVYLAHTHVPGTPLTRHLARAGALHFTEIQEVLHGILSALSALHERRIPHGAVRSENAILIDAENNPTRVVLLDAGSDRLELRPRLRNDRTELPILGGSPTTIAPEQLEGHGASLATDVYAFGALLYEVLCGRPPFIGKTTMETAFAHLYQLPTPPSVIAPHGFVPAFMDQFVLELLSKHPSDRPPDARAVLERFETLTRPLSSRRQPLSEGAVDQLVTRISKNPEDQEAALALEAAALQPQHADRALEALVRLGESLPPDRGHEQQTSLLRRVARLASLRPETAHHAEEIYSRLYELAPDDESTQKALLELLKRQGKLEEAVEILLARAERAGSRKDKARFFAQIGAVYLSQRDDREQALVAFTQTFTEDPEHPTAAQEIERLAGDDPSVWQEVLNNLSAAATDESAPLLDRTAIYCRMGRWWLEQMDRADLAVSSFSAALTLDRKHQPALRGLSQIYRKNQQWAELVALLARAAEAAPTPAQARDLRSEAAELCDSQLGDPAAARSLLQEVVEADPVHRRAVPALCRIYERERDYAALVELLSKHAAGSRGEERSKTLLQVGELCETRLSSDDRAIEAYEAALKESPQSRAALRALTRLYEKTGQAKSLLEKLRVEVELSPTPRQQIELLERIAEIHEREFFDHASAAKVLERVLSIDSEHLSAIEHLVRHYRALSRWQDLADLQARKARLLHESEQKVSVLLERAQVLESSLKDPAQALAAYEAVLEALPHEPRALEAVARLREFSGDPKAALSAIEALAAKATTPEAQAEQWVRAAKMLEGRGEQDAAIERYKRALDVSPRDAEALRGLREGLVSRGEVHAALQLLDKEFEQSEGGPARGTLAARMATLYQEHLHDPRHAEEYAKRALENDPGNQDALRVLGEIAFEERRFLEASHYYEQLSGGLAGQTDPSRVLLRYVSALSQSAKSEKALAAVETLLRSAPDDRDALECAARVTFEHGEGRRAAELYQELLRRFGDRMDTPARADALYRQGEALRRAGEFERARESLLQAATLDPAASPPLSALAQLEEARGNWAQVLDWKTRLAETASGEERVQLKLQVAELALSKLDDRARAKASLVSASGEYPDDRRVLNKLMQLYTEEQDWKSLVDVLLRLQHFVDDPKQRAKYLHTAAIVSARHLGDAERALGFYSQVLDLEPGLDKALVESIELERGRNNHQRVEALLKRRIDLLAQAEDRTALVRAFDELGELYENKLSWTEQALDAYEAAHTLDPTDLARAEHLSRLYAADPVKHLDKAVNLELDCLRQDSARIASYRNLRRLYTEIKRADAAFCLCQALSVLGAAEPDELRFYQRMRSETAAPVQSPLTDDDWLLSVMHADAEPFLTSIFALIEAAVIGKRSQTPAELGYDDNFRLDLSRHPAPICQSLFYAAGVLGIPLPPTYENTANPGGISFLFTPEPSLVLGLAALDPHFPLQSAAFLAAQSLTYLRPGMYLRQLLSSGTALKAWLFAAIKLTSPQFPVVSELEGAVNEAEAALSAGIQGPLRDHLTRVVSKLLSSETALDLKRWVQAIDFTADRAGLIAAHDLEIAIHFIRATEGAAENLSSDERVRELILYSVSPAYFEVRQRLGIAVD